MATTQKMYLGSDEIGITKFGKDGNTIRGAFKKQFNVDFIVVAGGGGGGDYSITGPSFGGGGGAGRYYTGSINEENVTSFSITIGSGGSVENDGGDSTFIGSGVVIRMNGGGRGADVDGSANSGGCGGGGSTNNPSGAPATNGGLTSDDDGIGFDGKDSSEGGAGGGDGITWFNGTTYARGGTRSSTPSGAGSGGKGGTYYIGTPIAQPGRDGVVVLRYEGTVTKATGGTITTIDGYTYHEFTSNGTFTFTG